MALDRSAGQLGVISGTPLQVEPADTPIRRSAVPPANPDLPHIETVYKLPATESFIAFAPMSHGSFCLLSWATAQATNTSAFVRLYDRAHGLSSPYTLTETVFPYSLQWLDTERIAILATGLNQALIYDLQGATQKLSRPVTHTSCRARTPGVCPTGSTPFTPSATRCIRCCRSH